LKEIGATSTLLSKDEEGAKMKKIVLIMICCLLGLGSAALGKDFLYVPTQGGLQIIDCDTDAIIHSFPTYYSAYILDAFYSEDGKMYYLADWRNIYAIDIKTNKLTATYPFFSDLNRVVLTGCTISLDNKYFFISCSITKKRLNIPRLNVLPPQLVVYDIKKREIVKSIETPSCGTLLITLRNDPNTLYLVGMDVYKVNISTGEVTTVMGLTNPEKGEEPKNFLPIWNTTSPKDHGIVSGPFYTPTVMGYFLADRNTGKISTLKADSVEMLYSTVISPDKKYLYGIMDEVFKVDMATGKKEKQIELEYGTCYTIAITSDGKKVYAGPAGNTVTVLDAATLKQLGVIYLMADGIHITRFSH
jgi:DNA-binding beta-propeller fold protein YncE